jgi:hypothetical protein
MYRKISQIIVSFQGRADGDLRGLLFPPRISICCGNDSRQNLLCKERPESFKFTSTSGAWLAMYMS